MIVTFNNVQHQTPLPQSCLRYNNSIVPFFRNEAVADDYRGYLVHTGGTWVYITNTQYQKNSKKQIKTLSLILESPHKDEYSYINGLLVPRGPALGKTGAGISKHLDEYVNKQKNYTLTGSQFLSLNINVDYRVLIMNAVQYQTSCFYKLGLNAVLPIIRNNVFKALYNCCNLNNDFYNRLTHAKPNVIFNACTYSLKKTISPEIRRYLQNNTAVQMVSCKHPCTWK